MTSGERFIGTWIKDQRGGKGTLFSANGSKFIGNFQLDLKHGEGVQYNTDGSVFEEKWKEGKLKSRI
jgi:hypothetical protein